MRYGDVQRLLNYPDPDARGLTRWWWYGCCVEKEEIDRELDFMHDADIGGVELQILYPVTPDDRRRGLHNIPYGSPEFYDIIRYTAEACQKRGMTCDFTPGSSWPYGGPTVEEEDAQQEAIPYQLDLHGPQKFSCDFTTRFAGTVCAAVLGRMENCVMLPETVIDVTDRFCIKPLFGWPWGTEVKEIDIPEGDWKLVFFVISQHHNHVGKPAGNAGGLVIDHCSMRATLRFLRHMVQPVMNHADGIHAIFCDSIEVEGHNWSGELLKEFRKRRGYDLVPYIYALWGDMGEITPHVRCDYFKTMSEMTIENFFDELTEFAHDNGALCRIQAHGTWGDILRVYAAADIPEGETFGDHRTLEVNTIHRRLAASAGHLYGKELISNETFTWLKRPRFTETLEEMKAAVDAVFLDGMNMIVNHGYAYSPEKAGKRGWPFYASTHINHTVPWWGLYRNLGEYIHRASAVLRQGRHDARVAVYLPQADVYADNMMSELHLAMRLEEHLGRSAMDAIQKAGYWFDYINDEALYSLGRIENGALCVNGCRYEAILLVGCTRLEVETAEKLRDFAASGGVLICEKAAPGESCGLENYRENAETVRILMAQANPVIVPDRHGAMLRALRSRVAPDVVLSHPDCVGFVHRIDGAAHLYFLSNLSDEEKCVTASFTGRDEPVRAWSVNAAQPMMIRRNGGSCMFTLAAHESALVVFDPALADAPVCQPEEEKTHEMLLKNWKLTCDGKVFYDESPVAWQTIRELRHFCGTGVYECTFDAPAEMAELQLSGLSAAAHVVLNGQAIGDIWTHPYTLQLLNLRQGSNTLRIEVASTLINEMMQDGSYEQCPDELPEWPYYGNVINIQRKARLNCAREFNEQETVVPCGLWGDVKVRW